jgi:hypothetical protein
LEDMNSGLRVRSSLERWIWSHKRNYHNEFEEAFIARLHPITQTHAKISDENGY